jgi:hypothetical protein
MKLGTFRYLILVFLVFFYLFPTLFKFVPGAISTRIVISFLGFIIVSITYLNNLKNLNNFKIKKSKIIGLILLISMAIISIISLFINDTRDTEYIKYIFSMILIYLSYVPIKILINKNFNNVDHFFISNLIINVVIVQMCVSLSMYFFPQFGKFINTIQVIDDFDMAKLNQTAQFRLVGLGTKFFGLGIINSFTLILLAFNIRHRFMGIYQLIKYATLFILIFTIGMMMSRTTLIGAVLGLAYIFTPYVSIKGFFFNNSGKFILLVILVPCFFIVLFMVFFPKIAEQFQSLFIFGFELFINFIETGKATSESTEDLKTMYIMPNNLKTYIIGDGKFAGEAGKSASYYMGTDVGFLRLIYYFGLIGTITYFIFQLFSLKTAMKKHNLLVLFCFSLLMILNFKGIADFFYIAILFNIATDKPDSGLTEAL